MRRARKSSKREPIISLINIVFLILIFFMVAGTLSQPAGGDLEFVQTTDLECCVEPGSFSIGADGTLTFEGESVFELADIIANHQAQHEPIRLLPDRNLPAIELLRTIQDLRGKGAEKVLILTEHAPT